MSTYNNSRCRDSDSGIGALLVVAALAMLVTGGIAIEAILLYFPFKRLTKSNPGRTIGVLGIIGIVAGSIFLAYQILMGNEKIGYLQRTSELAWATIVVGSAIYFIGIVVAATYEQKFEKLYRFINSFSSNGSLSQEEINQARERGRTLRLGLFDVESLIYMETHVSALALIERERMPYCEFPVEIIQDRNETCHAVLRRASFYKDVTGISHVTQGGTAYFRLNEKLTIAPSNYVTKSMPITELQKLDSGYFLLTSHRVKFQGQRFNFDFPYEVIEGLSEYSNGLQIHLSGKMERQIFQTGSVDAQLATALIRKLAHERRCALIN